MNTDIFCVTYSSSSIHKNRGLLNCFNTTNAIPQLCSAYSHFVDCGCLVLPMWHLLPQCNAAVSAPANMPSWLLLSCRRLLETDVPSSLPSWSSLLEDGVVPSSRLSLRILLSKRIECGTAVRCGHLLCGQLKQMHRLRSCKLVRAARNVQAAVSIAAMQPARSAAWLRLLQRPCPWMQSCMRRAIHLWHHAPDQAAYDRSRWHQSPSIDDASPLHLRLLRAAWLPAKPRV